MRISKTFLRTVSAAALLVMVAGPAIMSAQSYQNPYGTANGTGTYYDPVTGQYHYQYNVQFAQTNNPQALTPVYDPNMPNSRRIYLQCMQTAVQRRESQSVQAEISFAQQRAAFLQQRMQARLQVWTISDDRDRRDQERQVDRDFRDDERDLERTLDDQLDDIEDQFRDDRRECDRLRRDEERRERDAGRSRSSRSSRSSSSRSYFGTYGGTTGGTGANCQPYVCANGQTYPTCTAEGYPINYFANPCQYN